MTERRWTGLEAPGLWRLLWLALAVSLAGTAASTARGFALYAYACDGRDGGGSRTKSICSVPNDLALVSPIDSNGSPLDPSGAPYSIDLPLTLAAAARWSVLPVQPGGSHLSDGLRVTVEHNFAQEIGANTPELVEDVQDAVRRAFAAWESPVLRFQIDFSPSAMDGEILVRALTAAEAPGFFDYPGSPFPALARELIESTSHGVVSMTNGSSFLGFAYERASVNVNSAAVSPFIGGNLEAEAGCPQPTLALCKRDRLAHLLAHEIGHILGLGHPYLAARMGGNIDTDDAPLNAMSIDPFDPASGLRSSTSDDPSAIMNGTNSTNPSRPGAAWYRTTLAPDDVGGRDFLYPVPEPAAGSLVLAGLAGLAAWGRRRSPAA